MADWIKIKLFTAGGFLWRGVCVCVLELQTMQTYQWPAWPCAPVSAAAQRRGEDIS